MTTARILVGHVLDALPRLATGSCRCAVTSPPYFGLRSYGTPPVEWPEVQYRPLAAPGVPEISIPAMTCSLGNEETPEAFIGHLVLVFREVRRVLADDGTLWLNMGDSYVSNVSGSLEGSTLEGSEEHQRERRRARVGRPERLKTKDLLGIPWRVAFALQADGWWLRMDNIWHAPNKKPESVLDRPTRAHEFVFLLSKRARYYYDAEAVREVAVAQNEHDVTGPAHEAPGQAPHRGSRASGRERPADGVYTRNRRSVWGDPEAWAPTDPALVHRIERVALVRRALAAAAITAGEGVHILMATLGLSEDEARGELEAHGGGSVWSIPTAPYDGAHFATFPPALVLPCVLAGSAPGDTVLDPFNGSGTTGAVATGNGRRYVGVELSPDFAELAPERIGGLLTTIEVVGGS